MLVRNKILYNNVLYNNVLYNKLYIYKMDKNVVLIKNFCSSLNKDYLFSLDAETKRFFIKAAQYVITYEIGKQTIAHIVVNALTTPSETAAVTSTEENLTRKQRHAQREQREKLLATQRKTANKGKIIFSNYASRHADKYLAEMLKFASENIGNEPTIKIHLLEELNAKQRKTFMSAKPTYHFNKKSSQEDRFLVPQLKTIIFGTDKNFDEMLKIWSQPPFYWNQAKRNQSNFVVFDNIIFIMSNNWDYIITGFSRNDWMKSRTAAQKDSHKDQQLNIRKKQIEQQIEQERVQKELDEAQETLLQNEITRARDVIRNYVRPTQPTTIENLRLTSENELRGKIIIIPPPPGILENDSITDFIGRVISVNKGKLQVKRLNGGKDTWVKISKLTPEMLMLNLNYI